MSNRFWLILSGALFALGIVMGASAPEGLASLISPDLEALRRLAAGLPPFHLSTALFIFFKNASALLVSFIFSPLLLIVPVLALVMNGWLLSFVSVAVIRQKSLGYLLLGILPHGILELPALVIGEAAALSFGALLLGALFRREKRAELQPGLQRSVRYLLFALALFVPAALIETFITPLLLGM